MKKTIKIKVCWSEDDKGDILIDEDCMREDFESELEKIKRDTK